VVTLHTPTGAFGGPVNVAVGMVQMLRARGHDVRVASMAQGWPRHPAELGGAPLITGAAVRVIPGGGFSGLVSPSALARTARLLPGAEVVHVHLGRDLMTMPAALLTLAMRRPLLVQTHGMVERSDRRLAHLLDALATRRVLAEADRVLYLTEHERMHLELVAGRELPRAVQLSNWIEPEKPGRDPLLPPQVLFVARLHPRKRPVAFVETAAALLRQGVDAQFLLLGPDGGEAAAVRAAIDAAGFPDRIRYGGPVSQEQVVSTMRSSEVYVLPSVAEPWGRTLMEAMAVGTPVVTTQSCQLAPVIDEYGAGLITDGTVCEMAAAVRALLAETEDPERAGRRAAAGRRAVAERFAAHEGGERLLSIYRDVTGSRA
jgi:glycosyltransferase involved in cell wall biosynthesis